MRKQFDFASCPTSLPMHGAGKEVGKGLEHHIKEVLGLE